MNRRSDAAASSAGGTNGPRTRAPAACVAARAGSAAAPRAIATAVRVGTERRSARRFTMGRSLTCPDYIEVEAYPQARGTNRPPLLLVAQVRRGNMGEIER